MRITRFLSMTKALQSRMLQYCRASMCMHPDSTQLERCPAALAEGRQAFIAAKLRQHLVELTLLTVTESHVCISQPVACIVWLSQPESKGAGWSVAQHAHPGQHDLHPSFSYDHVVAKLAWVGLGSQMNPATSYILKSALVLANCSCPCNPLSCPLPSI